MLHTKNTNIKNLIYHLTHLPSFGKIQYKTEQTNQIITFSQRDIDEGIFLNNEPNFLINTENLIARKI
jgi:hypothetical protein